MKNNDKILFYYDNQLDVNEKEKFESQINESLELQEEFKTYNVQNKDLVLKAN